MQPKSSLGEVEPYGRVVPPVQSNSLANSMNSKRCLDCDLVFPPSNFHRNSRRKDGLAPYCRLCACARRRRGYDAEKNSLQCKAYRAKNGTAIKARAAEYRKAHKAQLLDSQAAYRQSHRNELAAKQRAYRTEHAAAMSKAARAWVIANPERAAEHYLRSYLRSRDELRDSYVANMLCQGTNLRPSQISQELIDLKRDQLRVHRLLTRLEKAIKGEPK